MAAKLSSSVVHGSWATSLTRSRGSCRRVRRAGVLRAAAAEAESSDGGDVENVVIVGSGPAGYTAAIYAGRANLRPLVFEGFQAGGVPGGQLMTTTEVENFPGFPEGITGPDLMDKMRKQAERWGAVLHTEDVEELDLSSRPFTIRSSEREVKANSVILATGATAKRLGIPSEEKYWSHGISACAICDGASPLFKDEELAVVGGGDTATEEALYLTKYGRHIHLLVRGSKMRASKAMQDRVLAHKNITVHFNTECTDASGNSKGYLNALQLKDTKTGEERTLKIKGFFYGIGHNPNSSVFNGQVELDEAGYVRVGEGANTSVEGVFSAGDLHDAEWRQAITAAGSGCMAAISVERYLAAGNLLVEYHQDVSEKKKKADTAKTEEPEGVRVDDVDSFNIKNTKHAGQFALRKLYHESDRVLMVMYTAPTCGPCRRLKPMLDKVVQEYDSNVHYVEIDIETDPEIAEAAGVMGTPCVHVFKKKERVKVMNGVKMKKEPRLPVECRIASPAARR